MERTRAVHGAALVLSLSLLSAAFSSPIGAQDGPAFPGDSLAAANVEAPETAPAAAPAGGLGPTTAPPWNPPGPISSRRGWEQALLLPGRIVSLPLVGLAEVMDPFLLYVEQTALLQKAGALKKTVSERFGIEPALARLGDRTGLGLKVEAQAPFFGGALRNYVRAAHSASTRHYHLTEVHILGEPLAIDYAYEWRPQERFFGIGMETAEGDLTDYASQSEQIRLAIRHRWNRDEQGENPRTEFSAWAGPRALVTRTGRESGVVSIEQRFPAAVAPTLDRRLEHLTYGLNFRSDWRVGAPHWANGWRVLLQGERFDFPIEILALRSGRSDGAQFTRLTYELETGLSFLEDPRTVRIMGRVVDQIVSANAETFLISDLAKLGGRAGLGGFRPGRFHDRDLFLMRLSYVFPLVRRFEIELHTDAGGTFPDVWGAARLDQLEQCFGIALRGRLKEHPLGSVGLDFSHEGVRVRYSLGRVE